MSYTYPSSLPQVISTFCLVQAARMPMSDLEREAQPSLGPGGCVTGRRLLLVDEAMSTGGALTTLGAYLRAWAPPSEARAVVMLRNHLGGDGGDGNEGGG